MSGNPGQEVFWFASQALGMIALLVLAISVGLGLAMSSRIVRVPGLPAKLKHFHEASMLVTLGLIAGHGGLLLFDGYLRPGLAGIVLPFALSYRPAFTGMGIIAAWLAAILGLSFYARRRIGARTWRSLHRFTILVYLLVLGHVVGAGTHGRTWWMLTMLAGLTAPIVFVFTYRVLPALPRRSSSAPRPAPGGGTRWSGACATHRLVVASDA